MFNKLIYSGLFILLIFSLGGCKGKRASQKTDETILPKNKNTKDAGANESVFATKYINGCTARMKGNVTEALKLFNECKDIDPSNTAVKYELATVNKLLGVNDLALAYAKECVAAEPKNEWYQLLLADCYRTLKQYNNSIKVQENLVKTYPNNSEFKENLAIEYTYVGEYYKAYDIYNGLEKQFGINEQITLNKIKLLQQEKKTIEIEKEIMRLIESSPENARYLTYLAEHFEYIKQPEKAKEIYTKIIQIDPMNPTVHLALSDYYKQKGDEATAYTELKLAFLNPELDVITKYNIGAAYLSTARKFPASDYGAQGLELVEIMHKVHPSSPESNSLYGDYLFDEKKYKEAVKFYHFAALKDNSDYSTWVKLLDCDELLGQNDSLEKHSFLAMELFPSQPMVYYYNGLANLNLKNYIKATQSLKDGLEYIVDDKIMMSTFFSFMGDAYYYLKEFEKSDKALDDALKVNSDNFYVLNHYAYYLSQRKEQLEKAEKLSKKSIELKPNEGKFMDTYGWILFQQSKFIQAEEWLQKAADLYPKNSNILEHLGDCLFKLNKINEAIKNWELAIKNGGDKERLSKKIKEKTIND